MGAWRRHRSLSKCGRPPAPGRPGRVRTRPWGRCPRDTATFIVSAIRIPGRRASPGAGRAPVWAVGALLPSADRRQRRFTSEPWVGAHVARGGRPRFPRLWEAQLALPAPGRAPAPVLAASGPCGRYSSGRFYSCSGALNSRRVWWRSPRPPTRPAAFGGRSLGASARVCWCSGSFSSPHVNVSSFISSVSQV